MRVIAGERRGFQLKGPAGRFTRPMADRIKEAVFSMLASLGVAPVRVLDLYAGTGGIGIEALSRGAEWADFVEQNHAAAQYNVGVAYAEGKGIPQNYAEAQKWFLKAAERGLSKAQFNLGVIYEEGLGGASNLAEAYRWYKVASTSDEPDAQKRLADVTRRMSPAQVAKGEELVRQTSVKPKP